MEAAITLADPICLPILDSPQVFPVQTIYCVGRNYADHAVEMGHDPNREPPFFFIKPSYSILQDGAAMTYPARTSDLQHEIELVVAIGKPGENIQRKDAADHVFGYGVGLDMTRRDLQAEAKAMKRPWEAGKTFLHAAPCSALAKRNGEDLLGQGNIQLFVNGEQRQQGDINQMIWKIEEIISELSQLFPLKAGDLIYTGTPAGVGPLNVGDTLLGIVEHVGTLNISIAPAKEIEDA